LVAVANSRTFGVNFSTRKEEYVTCWFRTTDPVVTRDQLRLEVGDFGVPALYVRPDEDGTWMANFRLPPGLRGGWSPVRLRFADSAFGSTTLRIAVDQPLRAERLLLKGVCDGTNWNAQEVKASDGGFISCWVTGLPENCDRANVGVYLGESKLRVQYVGEPDPDGMRQINAALPEGMGKGEQLCRVECGGVSSEIRVLRVV
jgi:uncharacterized protein (TIGR03437 family)